MPEVFVVFRNPLPASLTEGIPITEVSRWLGHKSIEVTHQIYGHLVPASLDRARTTLDNAYQSSRR
jgi:integrase